MRGIVMSHRIKSLLILVVMLICLFPMLGLNPNIVNAQPKKDFPKSVFIENLYTDACTRLEHNLNVYFYIQICDATIETHAILRGKVAKFPSEQDVDENGKSFKSALTSAVKQYCKSFKPKEMKDDNNYCNPLPNRYKGNSFAPGCYTFEGCIKEVLLNPKSKEYVSKLKPPDSKKMIEDVKKIEINEDYRKYLFSAAEMYCQSLKPKDLAGNMYDCDKKEIVGCTLYTGCIWDVLYSDLLKSVLKSPVSKTKQD